MYSCAIQVPSCNTCQENFYYSGKSIFDGLCIEVEYSGTFDGICRLKVTVCVWGYSLASKYVCVGNMALQLCKKGKKSDNCKVTFKI